jgi:hypothetical protein
MIHENSDESRSASPKSSSSDNCPNVGLDLCSYKGCQTVRNKSNAFCVLCVEVKFARLLLICRREQLVSIPLESTKLCTYMKARSICK